MAYAIQTESEQMVLDLIRKAVKMSGEKNVVLIWWIWIKLCCKLLVS